MKAVILAAGYGRRMRPLTDNTHKTLLKVGGRAIIEWIVDALLANDVTDITIVTGYRADELRTYLTQTYPDLPIGYIHNDRFAQTNNIYSLALALDQLVMDGDLILIECDLIFEPTVLTRLLTSLHPNVALVDRYRSGMDGTVVKLADDVITDVIPPHRQDPRFDFSDKFKTLNLYRFSETFCAGPFKKLLTYYAPLLDDNQYYELILGILIYLQHATIHAEVLGAEKWTEIDDPNDLEVARFVFEPEQRQSILERSYGGYWQYNVLDFSYLRNMYFPTDAVLAELTSQLPTLVQNYGSAQPVLERKLAYLLLCHPDRLVALNGASQAYPLLQQMFDGQRVLIPQPTFGEYPRSFPNADSYADTVGIDPDRLAATVGDYELVVLVNPNTPTGSLLPTEWIYDLASKHRATTFLLDESFIEFSSEPSILSRLETELLENVILLKSLSKTLGVPGLRLGYLYSANFDFVAKVRAFVPIWNLNAVAEHLLEVILKHRDALTASYAATQRDREQFAARLSTVKIIERVFPSGGNFLLIELKLSRSAGRQLVECLVAQHAIAVKEVSHHFPGDIAYLRLAVRQPLENERLVAALEKITQQ